MTEISPLKMLIISPNPLARMGLAALLGEQAALDIIGESAGDDLSDLLSSLAPDVILWDCGWNIELAAEAISELSENESEAPPPIVALLNELADLPSLQGLGVMGYLTPESPAEQINSALQAAAQGLLVLDPCFSTLSQTNLNEDASAPLPEALSPRESEVLRLLAQGLPNKMIALQLGISDHTVKFHVNAILNKLAAQSRTEAVVRAMQRGLIAL